MKIYTVCLALLCSISVSAHTHSTDCQKIVFDAARIYTYVSVCSKYKAISNIFVNPQNKQATTVLFEKVKTQCGGDDAITVQARRYVEQKSDLKYQLQVRKRATSTFCESKIPILRQILNNYK